MLSLGRRSLIYRVVSTALPCLFAFSYSKLALGNVVGNDIQNFNSTTDGLDFVTVHSSETLEPGVFNLGLMYNHAVNSLPYIGEGESKQNRLKYNDTLSTLETNIGYGVTENFSAGVSIPRLMRQEIHGEGKRGEFSGPGITNIRVGGKYRLFSDAHKGFAIAGSANFNRVKNNPYVGKNGSPIYMIEGIGDMTLAKFSLAVNLGYRYRDKGEPVAGYEIQPMGNQYIGSAAVSYLLPVVDTKLILEIFGSRPARRKDTGLQSRQGSSAELLGGVKFDYSNNLAFHAGAGTEMMHGVSSPDWRAYGGVNLTFAPERKPAPEKMFEAKKVETEERVVLYNVHFATGSDVVPESAIERLEAVKVFLVAAGEWKRLVIEGHTDSVGADDINQVLSERRATAVKNWLLQNLAPGHGDIEVIGFGESQPVADNGNFQGRQRNRRVEIRVIK